MTEIHGTCAKGFEKARDHFAKNFADGLETGASFAVMKDGELVVDLWGGHADAAGTKPWTRDTLANVWSTTKGVAAFCCALLVERGELDYGEKVATYWPEFAAEGKGAVTVAQMLSHQAGLSGLREPTKPEDFYNQPLMAGRLAAQAPLWEPGTRSGYHAITYGFLAGELVKRITGQTIGEFLQAEVAKPWSIDFFIGLPESEEPRAAEMIAATNAQDTAEGATDDVRRLTFTNPRLSQDMPNQRAWRAAEIPAAGGQGTASALARLYGGIASGGELDGVHLLSPGTIAKMRTAQIENEDLILGVPLRWGCGYAINMFDMYGPNPNAFGHTGWGGSFGCADPENGIAIGYVMNRMGAMIVGDPRAVGLVGAVYESLKSN